MPRLLGAGKALIRRAEGLKLKAYLCPAGIWTIGVGHTGPDVTPGTVWTEEHALSVFALDCTEFVKGVLDRVQVPLTDAQLSALVSFTFNIGLAKFQRSTMLRLLNAARYTQAADEFLRWNKAKVKGKLIPVAGLTARRQAERKLFLNQLQ